MSSRILSFVCLSVCVLASACLSPDGGDPKPATSSTTAEATSTGGESPEPTTGLTPIMTTTFDPAATDTHEPVPTTGEPTSDTTSDTSSDTSSDSGEVAECGNGQVERGEECDDGNSVDFDACTNACIVAFCGDSVVQPSLGEQCDGQANLPDHTICPDGGNCALSCYQDRNVTYVLCEGDDITMDGCKLAENC